MKGELLIDGCDSTISNMSNLRLLPQGIESRLVGT
jgi:hypothetical protein